MGGSESKQLKPPVPPPTKQGDIKVDSNNLPKLNMISLNVAKPPPIKTKAELKKDQEMEEMKDMVEFDLSKEFD